VQVQWGLRSLQIELDDMVAPDCGEKLWALRESESDTVVNASSSTQAAPAAAALICMP